MSLSPIKSLHFDPDNARVHDARNISVIKASLLACGQQKPIVINKLGMVIAGNGTLQAAKELGWETIWTVTTELEEKEQKLFALADNQTASFATWNDEILSMTLSELVSDGYDVESLGFEDWEPPVVPGLADDDALPDVKETNVKRGDIYNLGSHRLMCGDSTDKLTVEKLMNGEKADMVFTSPPYNGNTEIAVDWNNKKTLYRDNQSDNKTESEYLEFNDKIFQRIREFTKEDANVFYNINYNKKSRSTYLYVITSAERDQGFHLFETIVWKKTGIPNAASQVMTRSWEFIFLMNRSDKYRTNKEWHGYSNNFWEISNNNASVEDHAACFPIALPEKAILDTSKPGDLLYEPFCGAGTTIIACEKTNRKCYGMEIDPHYCQVIIDRWQNYTGKLAVKL